MTEGDVGLLLRECMLVVLKLGGPVLLVALAVGMLMSVLQAATQINEQALAFVPKIVGIGLVLVLTGSFMMTTLNEFARMMFDRMVQVGGS